MSYSYNPSADTSRPPTTSHYSSQAQPAALNGNGVSKRINTFFDSKDLPMYKDKPYASSGRQVPVYKQKRVVGAVLGFLILVIWLLGSGGTRGETMGGKKWDWNMATVGKGGMLDERVWEMRRESVKEAFKQSWDGYEKHAWGEHSHLSSACLCTRPGSRRKRRRGISVTL